MTRRLAVAMTLVTLLLACGRYGPPERAKQPHPQPAAVPAAPSAPEPPAPADEEEREEER